jgi:hypothetical protein
LVVADLTIAMVVSPADLEARLYQALMELAASGDSSDSGEIVRVEQRWIQYIEARNGGLAIGAQGPGSTVVVHPDGSCEQAQASEPAEGTS